MSGKTTKKPKPANGNGAHDDERAARESKTTVTQIETTLQEPGAIMAESLVADITDAMIQEVKNVKDKGKPWDQLGEEAQRDLIMRLNSAARGIARAAIGAVAARGFDRLDMSMGDGAFKEDGELSFKVKGRVTPENLALLARNRGCSSLQVIFADVNDYQGTPKTKAAPDQGSLIDEEMVDPDTGEVRPMIKDKPVFENTTAGQH